MTAPLPTWAQTGVARALLSTIVAERPEARVTSNKLPSIYGGHREPTTREYVGKPAGLLRRIRTEWIEREFAKLDQTYAATGVWDEAASKAVLGCETADDIIERMLNAPSQAEAA